MTAYRIVKGPLRIFGVGAAISMDTGDIVYVARVKSTTDSVTSKIVQWAVLTGGGLACITDGVTIFMEPTTPPQTQPLPGMNNDYATRQRVLTEVIAAVERLRLA